MNIEKYGKSTYFYNLYSYVQIKVFCLSEKYVKKPHNTASILCGVIIYILIYR